MNVEWVHDLLKKAEKKGISQSELCKRAGLSRTVLRNWRKGVKARPMSIAMLEEVIAAYPNNPFSVASDAKRLDRLERRVEALETKERLRNDKCPIKRR